MGARPSGPQLSSDLLCGDYLRVSAPRAAVYGHGVDEGFARIEQVEHFPAEAADAVFDYWLLARGPIPTVWCHGLPGPVILSGGDVDVLDVASPHRIQHEESHPWWPPADDVLLRGARPAGVTPHRTRRQHDRRVDEFDWPDPAGRDRMARRATSFTKPASALLVGDYLGVHPHRWPGTDRDVDEGFSRVEHVRLLEADAATDLFAAPSWHTEVVVVSVHGLSGVLLLRGAEEVGVLAFVNPERAGWERRARWSVEPMFLLRGSHEPTEDESAMAAEVDAARRPTVDEGELYPSEFRDPFTRRMMLESVHGFRSMPLSALPWPHGQFDCPLGDLAEQHRDRVPDVHGAHAAAALSAPGQDIRAACEYHQADWPRLVRMLEETLADAEDDLLLVETHPEFDQLSPEDQEWVKALVVDPIKYDDGSDMLTNGQHRLCAMRFAGVVRCPVHGNYLPDTDYGPPAAVEADARAEITASWRRLAAENGWPLWVATVARFLPPAWRAQLIEDNPPRRRRRR